MYQFDYINFELFSSQELSSGQENGINQLKTVIIENDLISYYDRTIGSSNSDLRSVLIRTIIDAGVTLVANYRRKQELTKKDSRNISTAIDMKIEGGILSGIKSNYPDHKIMSEEGGTIGESQYIWIVDPIDGTLNFINQIPFTAISIGLLKEGEPLLGAVYDPLRQELFFAERNGGSWLGENQISVSMKSELLDSSIGLDLYYDADKAIENVSNLANLVARVRTQRIIGCSALGMAYVSCGRLDAYYHNHVLPWDVAAGQLLVIEANGTVSQFDGNDFDVLKNHRAIIGSNQRLHGYLVELLS